MFLRRHQTGGPSFTWRSDAGPINPARAQLLLRYKIYFGADGLLIYWAHKKNTLGGDHAATTQSSLAKAADWRTPLPGMRATDVSYVH
jgi:hypothetical protein